MAAKEAENDPQFADSLALWLADYYLLSTVLLALALVGIAVLKQPAQRLAIAKATLVALALLAALCALPRWSIVHLLIGRLPATVPQTESVANASGWMPTDGHRARRSPHADSQFRKSITTSSECHVPAAWPKISWPRQSPSFHLCGAVGVIVAG